MGNYCCSKENNNFNTIVSNKYSQKALSQRKRSKSSHNFFILHDTEKKLKSGYFFRRIAKIGDGGQSQVYLARIQRIDHTQASSEEVNENQNYALKQISKSYLTQYYQVSSIILEKAIMETIKSNFIEKLQYYFQDQRNIYLFKKVAAGGDLYCILQNADMKGLKFKKLQGQGLKFVISGIILGLDALHNQNIIYRDLKTENILINDKGYPYLTDFGLSVQNNPVITQTDRRGTDLYMAPEMLYRDLKYDHSVDLWALGVLIYFMLYGQYPYTASEIHSSQFMKLAKQKENSYHKTPYSSKFFKQSESLRDELHDLMNKLLKVNPQQRIGYNGIKKIKQHPFFGLNQNLESYWSQYQQLQLQSPLLSIIADHKILYQQISDRNSLQDYIMSPETRCSNQNEEQNFGSIKSNFSKLNAFSGF